jgi:hypothetical protein
MKLHEKTRRHVEIFLLDQKKIDWIDSGANWWYGHFGDFWFDWERWTNDYNDKLNK